MRRKLLSLALVLAMCLVLTIPALAADVQSDKCTYELSNDPIGTAEYGFQEFNWETYDLETVMHTVYVVPDSTTVTSKTAPSGRIPYEIYSEDEWGGGYYTKAGEAFIVTPTHADTGNDPVIFWVRSEDLSPDVYNADDPISADDGIYIVAASAATAAGITTGTTPSTPSTATTPAQTTPTDTATGFTDVKASDYFAEPVAWAVEKGITNGTGNNQFSPSQNCTNAQILTFLWRASGQPEPTISNPFTNTISDAYLKAAIWAYEKGMVSGSTFDTNAPCTRAMAVTYMWQAADGSPSATLSVFTDVPASASYAQAVAWAVTQGITTGTSGTTFSPDDICTRGQIATFLYRYYAKT